MPEKRYFCTLFDSGYLIKGVAMLQSLKRFCSEAQVFVLCMDSATQEILEKLPLGDFVVCIPLADIEDDALLGVKNDRSVAEYCWTLSSCFPWYVLQQHSEIDLITYLDADLLFYSSVEPLFDEIGNSSIAIIEHRFSPQTAHFEVNGRFCVEWVTFRRDDEGMACLSRWREQCIEWCYNRVEDGKMGDQKYLDEWPDRYRGCYILLHTGAGVAPWNYSKYQFSVDRKGRIAVDGDLLIFYHFHQFQLLDNGRFDRVSTFYTSLCKEPDAVYSRYESVLKECLHMIQTVSPGFSKGLISAQQLRFRRLASAIVPAPAKKVLRRFLGND